MAEINIQPKKKPVWPWVILALVILVGQWSGFGCTTKIIPEDNMSVPNSTGFRQAALRTPSISSHTPENKVCLSA